MSHFVAIVVTKPGVDREEEVERLLAPYHEFECTGRDKFVEDIDTTEETRQIYEKQTTKFLKDPDGNIHTIFDEKGDFKKEFSVEKDGRFPALRTRVLSVPQGWEEVRLPTKNYESFLTFSEGYTGYKTVDFDEEPDTVNEHKYGYITLDESGNVVGIFRRTNPNAQWDWWVEGGRWHGFLTNKEGEEVNTLKVSDLGIEIMRSKIEKEVTEDWQKAHEIIAGRPIPDWKEIRERHGEDIDAAREEYNNDPLVKDFHANDYTFWYDDPKSRYGGTLEDRIKREQSRAISAFAIVNEDGWHSKGKMGWFGFSNDAMTQEEWDAKVSELILGLPGDYELTVVDCHT